jgi:hypothetical protein
MKLDDKNVLRILRNANEKERGILETYFFTYDLCEGMGILDDKTVDSILNDIESVLKKIEKRVSLPRDTKGKFISKNKQSRDSKGRFLPKM